MVAFLLQRSAYEDEGAPNNQHRKNINTNQGYLWK